MCQCIYIYLYTFYILCRYILLILHSVSFFFSLVSIYCGVNAWGKKNIEIYKYKMRREKTVYRALILAHKIQIHISSSLVVNNATFWICSWWMCGSFSIKLCQTLAKTNINIIQSLSPSSRSCSLSLCFKKKNVCLFTNWSNSAIDTVSANIWLSWNV